MADDYQAQAKAKIAGMRSQLTAISTALAALMALIGIALGWSEGKLETREALEAGGLAFLTLQGALYGLFMAWKVERNKAPSASDVAREVVTQTRGEMRAYPDLADGPGAYHEPPAPGKPGGVPLKIGLLFLLPLALAAGCGVDAAYVRGDRETYDAVAREYEAWMELPGAKSADGQPMNDAMKARRRRTIETWEKRLVEAEGAK